MATATHFSLRPMPAQNEKYNDQRNKCEKPEILRCLHAIEMKLWSAQGFFRSAFFSLILFIYYYVSYKEC